MVYTYKHGFSGFAAKLTESQAQQISGIFTFKSAFWLHCIDKKQKQGKILWSLHSVHLILRDSISSGFFLMQTRYRKNIDYVMNFMLKYVLVTLYYYELYGQSYLKLFMSYQIAFTHCKQQELGITLTSLPTLPSIFYMTPIWVME